MSYCRPVVLTLLLTALAASPAAAQSDGVTFDGDSPTAKEYALPLAKARQQAGRGGPSATASSAGGQKQSELFGAGVGDESSGAGTRGATSDRKRQRGSSDSSRGASGRGEATPSEEAVRALAAATARPGAPGGSDTVMFVIAGIVLVAAGVGAGLYARRGPIR